MKRAAALAMFATVLGYLALMRADPSYGLLRPRGGLATVCASFCLAWLGILASQRDDLPLAHRFRYGAAAWIWLLAQAFGIAWLYWNAVGR